MNNSIYLVTSNPGKVASFSAILNKHAVVIPIEMLNEEYPENKEEGTTERVVLDGAKYCAEKFGKKVIVQDTGLFISALKGFPGVNTKFAIKSIGNEGIVKLMENEEKRNAQWIFSLGYCEPGKDPVAFNGFVDGTIADALRGDKGFGFDPIFIPQGYDSTFGERPDIRDELSPFLVTIQQLAVYLQ